MNANKILIAVDDSEASSRAVAYVATLIGGKKGFSVRLFHVLTPLSPELLEFVGSENTDVEERMEAEERAAQARWIKAAEKAAQPVFTQAESILRKAGVPLEAVETQFSTSVSNQDMVADILEEARASQCGTIVVGRESFSKLKELFRHHVGDELLRKGQGFTIWVVE
jgi:nucleotide-binding universal stress UspA family protein